MTDEVAALVLRNNYLQTLALSLAQRRGLEDLGFQQRLMQTLEQKGELDRAVEFLPDDVEIAERRAPAAAADAAGAGGAARLRQARALRRAARIRTCRTIPISAASSARYFPKADRAEIPRRAGAASAAPRDHRDAARQLDDQPRRAVAGGADRRPDRRAAGRHRVRLRRGARQLRHAGAATTRSTRSTARSTARCSSSFTPPCRTCCSTGWSGSCATPI